jgi:hypothetical protein
MRFLSQQIVTLSAGAAVFASISLGLLEPFYEWSNPDSGSHGAINVNTIGVGLLWTALARWGIRHFWFGREGTPFMNRIGYTRHGLFRDTWSAGFNRWLLHVDQNGTDRDLTR